LPVCIAISIFSAHVTRPPAACLARVGAVVEVRRWTGWAVQAPAHSCGWSTDHGGVRSLCGRRGKNHAKSVPIRGAEVRSRARVLC
jgi:hypothetical protein